MIGLGYLGANGGGYNALTYFVGIIVVITYFFLEPITSSEKLNKLQQKILIWELIYSKKVAYGQGFR